MFSSTTTTGAVINCRAIVLATGGFQTPAIPALVSRLAASVAQLSAATYTNPSQIALGTVLVIGDGATGRQVAQELAATHQVLLSTGRARRVAPQHFGP